MSTSLRETQLRLKGLLDVVDGICRRHGIPYWLGSGTLLGAVRHGGFIPWDDDVDIEMLRSDRARFIRACREDLPEGLCLQMHRTEPTYFPSIMKVRDTRTDIGEHVSVRGQAYPVDYAVKGYFLDIFFEEPSWRPLVHLSNALLFKLLDGKYRRGWSRVVCRTAYALIRGAYACMRLASRLFADRRWLYHSYGSLFDSRRRRADIFPLREITFEGTSYLCPADPDAYLTGLYGDYMTPPPPPEQNSHHVTNS